MSRDLATENGFHKYAGEKGVASDYQGGQGYRSQTLSGNVTLVRTDAVFQALDPGGASRDVTLPQAGASKGHAFRIRNTADAAEDLVVKDAGGSTVVTVSQNEAAWVVSNGTDWADQGVETVA